MNHIYTDTITVRERDIDRFGHVNNSVYLTYFEETRWRWLYAHRYNETYQQGFALVEAKIEFLKPVTFPNEVQLETYMHSPGNTSVMFRHTLSLTTEPEIICATTDIKIVFFDLKTKKAIPIPEMFRQLID